MITYNKILLTHDGSKLASAAIPHAISIAKTYNAELYVLEVIDAAVRIMPALSSMHATIASQTVLDDLAKQEKKAAQKVLADIKEQLDEAGITNVTVIIEGGDARDEIVKAAKNHGCELIVMATHGRSGLKRALLGSIADDVVRNAHCPVLLIRPSTRGNTR